MRLAYFKGYIFYLGYAYALSKFAKDGFDESKVKRDEKGKFAKKESSSGDNSDKKKTTSEEKDRKIKSIKIDFSKEINELPRLNEEDIKRYALPNKRVTINKRVFDKHPEVNKSDVSFVIGNSLYNPDVILLGNKEKPYINFISRVGKNKNTIVLLDVQETKDSFEVVNFHWLKDRQRKQKESLGERIKESQNKKRLSGGTAIHHDFLI